MKAHVIDQSLNESIAMSYYLITPINQHQLTGLISFHNHNGQSKATYKLHHQYVDIVLVVTPILPGQASLSELTLWVKLPVAVDP